jgi:hypothetical protein
MGDGDDLTTQHTGASMELHLIKFNGVSVDSIYPNYQTLPKATPWVAGKTLLTQCVGYWKYCSKLISLDGGTDKVHLDWVSLIYCKVAYQIVVLKNTISFSGSQDLTDKVDCFCLFQFCEKRRKGQKWYWLFSW